MNLLIVNDEKLTAETMKKDILWENYGISEVFTAYDTESGKQCIEEHPIDIMLCDIEMPGENGLALLRWVRENKKEIECVFLTCHASFAYAQEAISLGCQDYILIPAKYEKIGEAIAKVAERIRRQREEARYQEYGKYMLKEKLRQEEKEKVEPEKVAEEVSAVIMKNLANVELSVDRLAEQFHFHPVYLNRIFKKEKGVSVSQFIINERMKMAALMLESGQYGASEVAEKVGYSHYTNFYNMFKKYHGCSPASYLEKCRK
ncbi:MAG: response regulator [Eubacteriales bacterium]|nr:response regulator [Eubacteriales bacterium]